MAASGNITIDAGATLSVNSGLLTLNTGAAFPGAGLFRVSGGTLTVANAVALDSLTFSSSGTSQWQRCTLAQRNP